MEQVEEARAGARAFPAYGMAGAFVSFAEQGRSTMLEVLALHEPENRDVSLPDYPYIVEQTAVQKGHRTHATVCKTYEMEALRERLLSAGADFRWDEPTESLRRPRLWIGYGPDGMYRPEFDAGLRLEFWEPYQGRDAELSVATGEEPALFLGVESSLYLVDDLDVATAQLERNLLWLPQRRWLTPEGEFAEYGFEDKRSATIQLLCPPGTGTRTDRDHRRWGSGAYYLRFVVSDLEASCEHLRGGGAPFTLGDCSDGSGRPAVRIGETTPETGCYELVEIPS